MCSGLWRCLSGVTLLLPPSQSCIFTHRGLGRGVESGLVGIGNPHFSSFPVFYSASKFASGKRCTSAWRINMESVQNPQAIISSWRTVFLADCLPECVSPHMGLFLAGGYCALVCVLAGVGIWRRAPEKTGCLLS